MENLYIGVDGGGTKTEAVIENEAGETIGIGQAGPGNIKSVQSSFQSMEAAIAQAVQKAGIKDLQNYHLHVGLGMAGSEVPEAKAAFLQIPHPFHTMVLNSDAYVACLGVHGGKNGAIIIVGTGVIGFQIEEGKDSRVGGYGFPHADVGGGAWLGLELLRATFLAYDGRISWTPVLERTFNYFNRDIAKMTTYANAAKPANFGEFAPFVIEALDAKESFAIELIERAADEINEIWEALKTKSASALPCCLLGGIAPFLGPYLSHNLRSRLVARKMNAPHGAILMLKKHMESAS